MSAPLAGSLASSGLITLRKKPARVAGVDADVLPVILAAACGEVVTLPRLQQLRTAAREEEFGDRETTNGPVVEARIHRQGSREIPADKCANQAILADVVVCCADLINRVREHPSMDPRLVSVAHLVPVIASQFHLLLRIATELHQRDEIIESRV